MFGHFSTHIFFELIFSKSPRQKNAPNKRIYYIFRIRFVSYYKSLSFSVGVHTSNYSVISILVSDILVRKEGK